MIMKFGKTTLLITAVCLLVMLSSCSHDTDTAADTREKSDWLILWYADGDSNITDEVYKCLQETCNGLKAITNDDGTPKTGYASVKVVTLWDGSAVNSKITGNYAGSYLWELQPGSIPDADLGKTNTIYKKDVSDTASWLVNSSGEQEVTMSSKQTLINFLTWANARYAGTHTAVILSDHGGAVHTDLTAARSMFTDNTAGDQNQRIETTDYGPVLKQCGFNKDNKLELFFLHACLEGTLETMYEVKDCARYCAASANVSMGGCFAYDSMIKSLTTDADGKTVGRQLINDYMTAMNTMFTADTFKDLASDINTYYGNPTIGGVSITNENVSYLCNSGEAADGQYFLTGVCVDLSKIDSVCASFNSLASAINALPVDEEKYIAEKYLRTTSPLGNTLMYDAYDLEMFDAGYFAYQMQKYGEANKKTAVAAAAADVETALSSCIITSWRDGYRTAGNQGLYYYDDGKSVYGAAPFNNNWFGLTIGGGSSCYQYWYGVENKNYPNVTDTGNQYCTWYRYLDFTTAYPEWNRFLATYVTPE
jgi:hypothetical protein